MAQFSPINLVTPPQPYFLPGYTGCCPGISSINGRTYGRATHLLLMNPSIKRSEHTILAKITPYSTSHPSEIVKKRNKETDVVYNYPMSVSYAGFVPRAETFIGMNTGKTWKCALANFEEQQRCVREHYKILANAVQDGEENKPIPCDNFSYEDLNRIKEGLM